MEYTLASVKLPAYYTISELTICDKAGYYTDFKYNS